MKDKKVLLVTGASSEVGQALIRAVAENYETVLAHYCRSREPLEALQREFGEKIVCLQADFSDLASVASLADRIAQQGFSPDHVVHLPAQKAIPQKFHKTDIAQYVNGFYISVVSIAALLQCFLPAMSRRHYGKVVMMLTSYTLNAPPKYLAPYITVKYALLGLMRELAGEYADKGIMVNGVSPDMMETKFLSDMPELIIRQYAENSPAGRNLTVEDVIPTFEYLLSDGADMVTGQNIGISIRK